MNALLCSQISPFCLAKLHSPWKPKPLSLLAPNLQNLKDPSRKWKLEANAKGFSSRKPPTVKESTQNINQNINEDDEIPKEVSNRIIIRILVSVGLPMAVGLAFLNFFEVVKEQGLFDVPVWIPFLTTFVTFGASALGIAYGALSTSWDANKKGSLLGLEEAQQNWVEMWKEEDDSN
ncbi:hypothetical protein JCGZ_26049 [Jatropha curcas]|uniref:Uncharacterized protein n=1 Tax=Jatropha curcas TaxID=180498 RepID=A0A067JHH7_JATCU|nr:uncharacterized protein PAM68-like [Jatropha curcas]KDP22218.1 hypothetical protein JCGZ_26049 [Jatropha curcas]